ncbi:hypothetical protein [Nocardioides sp. cx-173]|uniref:hypothetical protein n=1 Tax=Nocardioides sp. cx-173 TaxID=2898796 RepID=UPI001E58B201|nr:hypothetical protein [Nocardioides sp. cx-173]MCD4524910.1 hypothetical protein [Nocardioides sp. cx-173]UGB43412.1 hypothetical protein LQ940_07750 [Nocardioides sp. cx-173]
MSDQVAGLLAGLVAAALFGVAAVVQASAVRRIGGRPTHLVGFVLRSVRDPLTMLVVAAYLGGFVLHAVAIWLLPLYLAQALISLSLPVTALASRRVSENLSRGDWVGVGAVTAGLALLSLGSGEPGEVVTTWAFALPVALGVVLLLAAAMVGREWSGPVLGALAGLGYAGSAIAVRGVGLPLEAPVVLAALAVPAFGLVSFWLYSLGMHSNAVTGTTAPMIVGQTLLPAAIGVALLGDGVRDGWAVGVAVGLVLATAGAAAVSRSPASAATAS